MKKTIFLLMLAVLITGCGGNIFEAFEDQKTTEAVDFEISKDADLGNYDAVLDECPANASAIDCATAAMGKAGFDLNTVLDILDGFDTSSNTGDLALFASFELDPKALDALRTAKEMLLEELGNNPGDSALSYQLVMLSFVDIATLIADGVKNTGGNILDGINKSEATVLSLSENKNEIDKIVGRVANDVGNIVDCLPDAGFGASVTDSFEDLIKEPKGINYDGVGVVTTEDLQNYLAQEFGN